MVYEGRFQFLIGTVQQRTFKRRRCRTLVSIPHRYSTTLLWQKNISLFSTATMFQFLIGTVQQQYLCGLSNTLFQNIVYNMPKSRSIYFLGNPKNSVKSAFLKIWRNWFEIDRLFVIFIHKHISAKS